LGNIYLNDNEEITFIKNELNDIGLDFPEFIISLILSLHWKFMETKGMAPKNKEFDKMLLKLKKEMQKRFAKTRGDVNG
jgi:hypothetical protein